MFQEGFRLGSSVFNAHTPRPVKNTLNSLDYIPVCESLALSVTKGAI